MAFDAGYADKINNALEEYRQDEGEMRQTAPGAENFKTKAEGQKTPEIKKEPVDGSVEITFDPDGMTANMILHKAYNGGRPVTAAIVMAELLKKGINTGIDDLDIKDMVDGGVYETPICVARAIPPKRGENGSISFRYEASASREPRPRIRRGGFPRAEPYRAHTQGRHHRGYKAADSRRTRREHLRQSHHAGTRKNAEHHSRQEHADDRRRQVHRLRMRRTYYVRHGRFNVEDTVTVKYRP